MQFVEVAAGTLPPPPRPLETPEGVADRLRAAAFAEVQARDAFRWAAERFAAEVPDRLRTTWLALAIEEQKHLDWLLARMQALGIALDERPVSGELGRKLMRCETPAEFAHMIATAEDRGRRAGERFAENLNVLDPETGEIFRRIALEERAHIALAERYFPEPG